MGYGIKLIIVCSGLLLALGGTAQKKALTPEAYAAWKRVDRADLSADGKWVMYRVAGTEDYSYGNAPLYLYQTEQERQYTLPRVREASFWGKGKWLSYTIADTSAMRKDTTVLLNLRNMKETVWDRPYAFTPLGQSEWATYTYRVETSPADTVAGIPATSYQRLVMLDMATGDSIRIDSIGFYTFYNHNRSVAYVRENGKERLICYGPLKGKHQVLYRDPEGRIRSFLLKHGTEEGTFSVASDSLIYAFSLKDRACRLVFDRKVIPVPDGFQLKRLNLSDSYEYVTYELWPVLSPKPGPKPEPDKSFELELWTWDEDVPQSRQAKSGYRPQVNYPKHIYFLNDGQHSKLTSATTDRMIWPDGVRGDYVITTDQSAYYPCRDWKENLNFDAFLVNIRTGETRLLMKNLAEYPVWSPNGKYALIYSPDHKAWYKVEAATGEMVDISSAIGYPVYNEEHDKPCAARAYGIAGWSEDGNRVILYDRYDLWVIDLTGREKTYCFTKGFGRNNRVCIRMLRANYDPVTLNLKADNLVETFWEDSKDEGVYVLNAAGNMRKLIKGAFSLRVLKVSDDLKYCIFHRQSYTEFRDLWWSKMDFARPVKITDVNPQQKEYNWGRVELVKWTNYEGKPNEGLLYLPEDYDPSQKYPVLVQFYETHTNEMNVYHAPVLSAAMADIPTFVSHGYVVFMPDVHFTIGRPGQSCYDAVVSGTKMLVEKGIADPDRIGLQGHSWSGFQTAYLVAKTDLFRCANIGAPIVDMVSGYVGIRNGSGLIRFFMYEDTQSRMGKSIWEDKTAYLQNSPLLDADRIHTPLLIFHCDEDEAVAYEQGRALYLAMRRLQRPAWLLNYKGDGHFLSNPAAQLDWTVRMQQFFDYYLKDAPQPRWMKEGININERGIDQKYDFVE